MSTLNRRLVESMNWHGYFLNFEFISFAIFFTVIIPNLTALIFVREYTCKTTSTDFSYPRGRLSAFFNKFIMSILVIAAIYVTSYIFVVLSGFVFLKTQVTAEHLIDHLKVFLVSFGFQVMLVPFTIIAASAGKNMIISFAYSMLLIAGNANYLMGMKHKEFIFSILPALPVAKLLTSSAAPITLNTIIQRSDMILGSIVFLTGIAACVIFYRKADIY
jgi:bacitracin transport system permease protein